MSEFKGPLTVRLAGYPGEQFEIIQDANGMTVPLVRVADALNRPSLLGWVPEGWHLGVVRPEGAGWSAFIYQKVPPQLSPINRTGFGPTPESAVQDAASRVNEGGE